MTQNGHSVISQLPETAVLLTEEIFEATTRKWVKLPQMSFKLSKMTVEDMLREGWLKPVEKWSDTEKKRVTDLVVKARETAVGDLVEAVAPDLDRDSATTAVDLSPGDDALLAHRAQEIREAGAWVEVTVVGFSDVLATHPYIPGQENWPKEAEPRMAEFKKWFDAQSAEGQAQYLEAQISGQFQLISLGLLQPKLTAQQLRRLADDAAYLSMEIGKLSGLPSAKDLTVNPRESKAA